MFDLRLHTEILNPLSILLMVLGAILGYGGGWIIKIFNKNASEKYVLLVKFAGLLIAAIGILLIFKH